MKTKTFVALAVLAGFVSTSASAGEWADACVERLEADGRDTSGCSCLEAEIEANPSLEEEFMSLGEIEDPAERYDAASSEAQAAMSQCTR